MRRLPIRSSALTCGSSAQSATAELETFWAEWRRVGRLLGVRDRDLPERWTDFRPYFDEMIRDRLEPTDSVRDVLESLAKPPPPAVPGMSEPLWRALRVPAARGAKLGTVGLMPGELVASSGLEWTDAQQLELRAVGAASQTLGCGASRLASATSAPAISAGVRTR